jgi:hypothetical protein
MRAFVLALALLAGLKLWIQDTVFRSATEEAMVKAYRERAIQACQRDVQRDARGQLLAASVINWSKPASIRLEIGKKDVDVYAWDVDNALWATRFKTPYLKLTAGTPTWTVVCEYDVAAGSAVLARM